MDQLGAVEGNGKIVDFDVSAARMDGQASCARSRLRIQPSVGLQLQAQSL